MLLVVGSNPTSPLCRCGHDSYQGIAKGKANTMTVMADAIVKEGGQRCRKLPPMAGKEYADLLVIEEVDSHLVLCRCLLCGKEKTRHKHRVFAGITTNCGCVRKPRGRSLRPVAGPIETGGRTPEERLDILRQRKREKEEDLNSSPVTVCDTGGLQIDTDTVYHRCPALE